MTEVIEQKPVTGPMKFGEMLEEWERMKLDNAKKHQEEIRQRILTQTGKIFADYDNSIKSGILGELEREEESAQNEYERGIFYERRTNNCIYFGCRPVRIWTGHTL